MKIVVVEPFYTESHKKWLDELIKHSSHTIIPLTLTGLFWKWRMHGGAVTLARTFKQLDLRPDLIVCTDMLDVNVFCGLLRKELEGIPIALYFHENQISYPWSPADQDVQLGRDRHYGFINYTSALAVDRVYFNSHYHSETFVNGLGQFLNGFPDHLNLETMDEIAGKSEVLSLGMDLNSLDSVVPPVKTKSAIPIILWNHRWEYDKNPEQFFKALFRLKDEGHVFKLVVLGREYPNKPSIFDRARRKLKDHILHWGYVESSDEYADWLYKADILPVTSIQDFFGISVVEAIYCGCIPLLPNRLAYPEHISESEMFYDTEVEFYEKLKGLVNRHPSHPNLDLEKIKSYDWTHQILLYDAAFSRLSANFSDKE
ncbi:tRNA-queuosine alpha-mannosyltransferase domain-containing protein [Portibacter marinus]|uniref:tRNA-queuosine alpha-mannosyltransferase domain-containing protein n=1 Tax=Portibacter marinus TaxID=2898660 RepID=UPI001F165A65|nr:DUF3524 domain-containing protein [Portibacter marinus]